MQTFSQLSEIIEAELGKIVYPKTPQKLYQPIDYVMDLGGKRMRPILLLMAYQLFDENIDKTVSVKKIIDENFDLSPRAIRELLGFDVTCITKSIGC